MGGNSNDITVPEDEKGIVVIGAGPYRIEAVEAV